MSSMSNPSSPNICPISQYPISTPGFLHCGHEFEKKEITVWLVNGGDGCPLCRKVCSIEEISNTAQEAALKANRLAEDKLRADELITEVEHIRVPADMNIGQALERMLQGSFRQMSSMVLLINEDANRLYRLFSTRVLVRFTQNFPPQIETFLRESGVQDMNVRVRDISATIGQRFNSEFISSFVTHQVSVCSPLLLHTLIEDRTAHENIEPPAYRGLSRCSPSISSQEIAREYMLCEQIQRLERDILLADSGVQVLHLLPDILNAVCESGLLPSAQQLAWFAVLQETPLEGQPKLLEAIIKGMKEVYPFWYERILVHFRNVQKLQGVTEDAISIEFDDERLYMSQDGNCAFVRAEIEFLFSAILLRSLPKESDQKEYSLAIKILERLTEQIDHPISGEKVKISTRFFQILGDLIPVREDETSEERGRSSLPLLFHMVHPTAILYAIAQLRSELLAYWQFIDPRDYQQEWDDMQQNMRDQGHL